MPPPSSILNRTGFWFYSRSGVRFLGSVLFLLILMVNQTWSLGWHIPRIYSVVFTMIGVGFGYTSLIALIFKIVTFEEWHFPITVITYFGLSAVLCVVLCAESYIENLVFDTVQSARYSQQTNDAQVEADKHPSHAADQTVARYKKLANDPPPDLETSFYFTTITFTTVGYGDVVPRGKLGRLYACFIALLGTTHSVFFVTMIVTLLADQRRNITSENGKRGSP